MLLITLTLVLIKLLSSFTIFNTQTEIISKLSARNDNITSLTFSSSPHRPVVSTSWKAEKKYNTQFKV